MHNYSKPEQFLHRIALSSQYLRELYFNFERFLFLKDCDKYSDKHVFITGLARSGTTILLNAIYDSSQFGTLTYADMPFILAPNFWSKINKKQFAKNSFERLHGDGIQITYDSPEAFEEVFWKTFNSNKKESLLEFQAFIRLILNHTQNKRYLSKNNQNIKRIDLLHQYFPNSLIIIPFREPLQHSFSLFTQHNNFNIAQENDNFILKYMKWIGHSEFGSSYIPITNKNTLYNDYNQLNHWLEQWQLVYRKLIHHKYKENILFVCYENLCDNQETWHKIQSKIGISEILDFNFKKSIKNVNVDFNRELYRTCQHIYKELINISIQ